MTGNKEFKPFLRWAGGKRWFVKYLDVILKDFQYKNYHEPFLGSGAVFFHLPQNNQSFLSDLNTELINAYVQVKDNVDAVIDKLQSFENTKEHYYSIRNKCFDSGISKAAQFIYLNQTSFNGIYRVNLKGVYNVPFGYRSKDHIQAEILRKASIKLQNVNLRSGQFDEGLKRIEAGDLVFLDPPYTITHNDNGFIKYNEKLFREEDQHRLSSFISSVIQKGAFYLLTNAAHEDIRDIFQSNEPIELSRASLIGGKKAKRGKYKEFLFTNLEVNQDSLIKATHERGC